MANITEYLSSNLLTKELSGLAVDYLNTIKTLKSSPIYPLQFEDKRKHLEKQIIDYIFANFAGVENKIIFGIEDKNKTVFAFTVNCNKRTLKVSPLEPQADQQLDDLLSQMGDEILDFHERLICLQELIKLTKKELITECTVKEELEELKEFLAAIDIKKLAEFSGYFLKFIKED